MKNKNAFTLIELLIAITVGMLVVGIGAVSLNNFNEQQKVIATEQELLADLRLARNYAITNQLPSGGNRVLVSINNNGLLTIKPQNSSNNDVGTSFFSKDITPSNIIITVNNTVVGVGSTIGRFSVTDGRSISGALNIGISGVNFVKNIKIDDSGLIHE